MQLSYGTDALLHDCLDGDRAPWGPHDTPRVRAVIADLRAADRLEDAPLTVTLRDGASATIGIRESGLLLELTAAHVPLQLLPGETALRATRAKIIAIRNESAT